MKEPKISDMKFWEAFWYVYGGVRCAGYGTIKCTIAGLYNAIMRKKYAASRTKAK